MDNKNFRVPQHIQIESISPATKLLEMRKSMYEQQEVFEKKKEAFKTSEDTFKRRENELKEKDLKIQESLIKFSKYLEENELKGKKAEEKAAVEEELIRKKKVSYPSYSKFIINFKLDLWWFIFKLTYR